MTKDTLKLGLRYALDDPYFNGVIYKDEIADELCDRIIKDPQLIGCELSSALLIYATSFVMAHVIKLIGKHV